MFSIDSKKVKIKNIYCVICGKYRVLYTFDKILVLSIICGKCGNEDQKIFKEEEATEILKIRYLIINTQEYKKNI